MNKELEVLNELAGIATRNYIKRYWYDKDFKQPYLKGIGK